MGTVKILFSHLVGDAEDTQKQLVTQLIFELSSPKIQG